ncbi:MAG TPA: acyl-CoA dehydrogenase [Acidimicrobiales bacterium]
MPATSTATATSTSTATSPSNYRAPVDDIVEALTVVGLDELAGLDAYAAAGVDTATVRELVEAFGRFAADVIAPTDRVGDVEGARFDPATGAVTLPEPFAKAYRAYVEGGWGALAFPPEHGGGGMPRLVGTALQEVLTSANMALSLNPILTQSAIELLHQWGTRAQQERYLPKLVTGEWTGTMNLTEPEAGSDLGAIRTTAVPGPDGTGWRVSGTKIFITWGEHDLADNIVHLVLARTPGAPPGTKGLSLFLVPKVLPDGARNALRAVSIEHKMGIHASPTCVMSFDGAEAELVGEQHGGMRAMFTMMNAARLAIAVQGLAVGEVAGQQAWAFARERRQGRAPGALAGGAGAASPIIEHPDVARMLLDIRASTRAVRLLLYLTAQQAGIAAHGPSVGARTAAQARVDLLTPIGKAWGTDTGFRLASLAVQVHGGMGYIEETGIAQRLRDARIAPIYEGTNGIQAIDLVHRKVGRDDGAAMGALLDDIGATVGEAEGAGLDRMAGALGDAVRRLRAATDWLVGTVRTAPADALAGATAYAELCGVTTGGWLLARRALAPGASEEARVDAEVFAVEVLSAAPGLATRATAGAGHLVAS